MCLIYTLKALFEKWPIFPPVNYLPLGSRRHWLGFLVLVPWKQKSGGTHSPQATLPLPPLPTDCLSSALTLPTERMWSLFPL